MGVLYEGVDEEGIRFGVYLFHGNLELVEGSGLGQLDFVHEILGEVFHHDAVASGEKGQAVGDKMELVVG